MKNRWVLSQEEFDRLLAWLDPDREQAGEKYEAIRRGLVEVFTYRRCLGAEDLADEVINRVARRLETIAETYTGDPVRYFYAVANMIHKEYLRGKPTLPLSPHMAMGPPSDLEQRYGCLEKCVEELTPVNRELIELYYRKDKQEKIEARKELGQRLKLTENALRVRAHRIRATLEKCVKQCLEDSL